MAENQAIRQQMTDVKDLRADMAEPHEPLNVCLICAITFSDDERQQQAQSQLIKQYGDIALRSPVFDFHHTRYYQQEMGANLKKFYIAFQQLIHPERLPEIKLHSNAIEAELSEGGKRTVNLDPGYLESAKLVLATTKNYEHRIYIGKNIYGDVQLRLRQDGIQFNFWTYPDYKEPLSIDFFGRVKKMYLKQLRASKRQ